MNRPLALDHSGRLGNRVFLDDPRVMAVVALLDRDGEQARVVGGAVRNALLDLPPGDIDIATTAHPDIVLARAKAAQLRTIPTGLAHGTVTVLVRGFPLEVTTLREDVETDGRHAVVRFGKSFTEDARRRDFTINALSADATGLVHDYCGGLADLAAGRVRFIGDAATRIREDYLRILRFFRFSASYATDGLDADGLAACAAAVEGLARLSRERIRAELFKLLVAPRAAPIVENMDHAGLLSAAIGLPCRPDRHARLTTIETDGGWAPEAVRRLAALALRERHDVPQLRDQLRLSNEERDRLLGMADALASVGIAAPCRNDILRLLHVVGRTATLDAVLLRHAERAAGDDAAGWRQAARLAAEAPVPTLPLSGADLLARGLTAGPLVGAVLKDVQARWIRAGFPAEPAVLHRLLDEAIACAGGSGVVDEPAGSV